MNGYELSRNWWDFCFENPEKINPNHSAIYFFAIEHCNRLGWKSKFGFPTQMAMDAIGIKKHETYIKYFYDLCNWGFFILVQKSTNQYSSNIISLSNGITKNGKALGNAILKHVESTGESTWESNNSIDKPVTKNLKHNKQSNNTSLASDVMIAFNNISGKDLQLLDSRKKDIDSRIKENFTIEDFKIVIEHKWKQWGNDEKMSTHFKPETLFCKKHFASYLEDAKTKTLKLVNSTKGKEPNPDHYANEETYLFACRNAGVTPKDYYNA